ncbi:MAG: response regulator [Nitrososphaeraceae archaeon]
MARILLVDDDKEHLKLFTIVLEEQGHSVEVYADPITALLKFRSNYYDLAVLDYLMPHLNGLDLYGKIKEIDSKMKCCIITATNEQFTDDEENPRRPNNLSVIRKPIGNAELLTEINSILGSTHLKIKIGD